MLVLFWVLLLGQFSPDSRLTRFLAKNKKVCVYTCVILRHVTRHPGESLLFALELAN